MAPKSHAARRGDVRSIALMSRQSATTSVEISRPIVNIAIIEFQGPAERNPFINERFGIKK